MDNGFRELPETLANKSDDDREEVKLWVWFVDKVLPCVNCEWRKHKEGSAMVSDYVSVSDEGFAHLLLVKIVRKWEEENMEDNNEEDNDNNNNSKNNEKKKRDHYTTNEWEAMSRKCVDLKAQRELPSAMAWERKYIGQVKKRQAAENKSKHGYSVDDGDFGKKKDEKGGSMVMYYDQL